MDEPIPGSLRSGPPALVRYDAPRARVARLTLDSPRNRNALSTALVDQLHDGFTRA